MLALLLPVVSAQVSGWVLKRSPNGPNCTGKTRPMLVDPPWPPPPNRPSQISIGSPNAWLQSRKALSIVDSVTGSVALFPYALLLKKKKFGVLTARMKCVSGVTLPSKVRRTASRGRLPRNCVEAEMELVLRLPLIVGNGPPGAPARLGLNWFKSSRKRNAPEIRTLSCLALIALSSSSTVVTRIPSVVNSGRNSFTSRRMASRSAFVTSGAGGAEEGTAMLSTRAKRRVTTIAIS